MAADIKIKYAASATITCTVDSLATSASLVAGREATAIDNGTSFLYDDVLVGVSITTGNIATAGLIEVWVVPALNDTPTWPDVFDGTDSAETVTSRNILFGAGALGKVFSCDVANGRVYSGTFTVAELFGGVMPQDWTLFVVHNTGVNFAASGNSLSYQGIHYQTV